MFATPRLLVDIVHCGGLIYEPAVPARRRRQTRSDTTINTIWRSIPMHNPQNSLLKSRAARRFVYYMINIVLDATFFFGN